MPGKNVIDMDVAILGGGFAGVYCARVLEKKLARSRPLKIGLISSENHMVFQPMLPEVVGGSISPRHVVNPLRLLCRKTAVFKAEVQRVVWPEKKLLLNAGDFSGTLELRFRHLVLALGAGVDLSQIPGMPEHAFLMRNVGDAMLLRATLLNRLEEGNLEPRPEVQKRLVTFVVVGGGYSGVETAAQIADFYNGVHRFYSNINPRDFQVYLVHSQDTLLPTLRRKLSEYTARELTNLGVKLVLKRRVKSVTAGRVFLDDGTTIETHTVVATVGNSPHPLIARLCQDYGFPVQKGRILVSDTCRVGGQEDLWAAGDCAAVPFVKGGFCPDTAQFAMRQGILIGENLARQLQSAPLRKFTFQGYGEMASLGHRQAVGDIMGFAFSGFIAWWIWRTVYLSKLPRLDRKVRVVLDWTLDLFFPRDINVLNPRYSTLLKEIYLEKDDLLFQAGEPAFSFYIVKAGRIEVFDERSVVQTLTAGDYFGERALLGDGIWNFSARAAECSTLISIPARIFHQMVSGSGSLGKLFQKSAHKYQSRDIVEALANRLPAELRRKTAAEVMARDVKTLRPGMTVREALAITKNYPHSSYPLVTDGNQVQGAVNREDLYELLKRQDTTLETRLESLTPAVLPTVNPDCPMAAVVENLVRSGSNKVLVVGDDRRLNGIITVMDLVSNGQAR